MTMTLGEIHAKKRRYETTFVVCIISFFLPFGIVVFFPRLGILIFPIAGGVSLLAYKSFNDFKVLSNQYKRHYVEAELKKVLPQCVFDPEKGFTEEQVFKTKLLKKHSRYHSEDYLKGDIQGKTFESADVLIQDVRSGGKSSHVVTIFQGRLFIIDFEKRFRQNVYLMPNRVMFSKMYEGMTRVDTESITFNKKFDVYSENHISAFYLLTPHFMEKLMAFSKVAKNTYFGFVKNKMYVAVDTRKDAFDLTMFQPIDVESFEDVKTEVNLIKDLIAMIPS
ncbi:MAG: DUF3137 domain-containing protein [Acholeplasmatales bacterium]|nr:MAG: DUF3137 domain-containing protein [Acholeplasmatales bacterium]